MFEYRHAWLILCNVGEVYIFEHGRYISALEHTRMLILSSYILLACINTICKYYHAWMIYWDVYEVSIFWSGTQYLGVKMCLEVIICHVFKAKTKIINVLMVE